MTMYEKYKNRLIKAVNDYNRTSDYKLDFNKLDQMVVDFQNKKKDDMNHNLVGIECEDFYKKAVKSIYQKAENDIRTGEKQVNDLKPIMNDVRGLLREFFTLGFIESLDANRDFKNKALKAAQSSCDHYDFNFYDKLYYKSVDTEAMGKTFPKLKKNQEKMINYQLKNFSGVVDYRNNLKRENAYTSENLINNLRNDNTNRENCTSEKVADYLVKYEALKQKHNSRNFISRFFHFAEKNALRDAEENIKGIIQTVEPERVESRDTLLAFVSKNIKGSEMLHEFGTMFLNSDKVRDYSNIREAYDSKEVLNTTKKVVIKELENDLNKDVSVENTNDDLNKTIDERDLLEEETLEI